MTYIGIQPKNKIALKEHFLLVKDILYKMNSVGCAEDLGLDDYDNAVRP